MFGFNRRKKYTMNVKAADMTLQNVFSACDQAPNQVPFDKIILRNKLTYRSDNTYISVTAVLLLLTFLIPVFLPHSDDLSFLSVDYKSSNTMSVVSHNMADDKFTVQVNESNIDVESSYILGPDNQMLPPLEYDEAGNTLVFPVGEGEYNVFIYDNDGRCLHLLISPRK